MAGWLIALVLISSLIGAVIGFVILYFIMKAAVRNGSLEAYDRIQIIDKKILDNDELSKEDECPMCFSKLENGICANCGHIVEIKNQKPV